MHFSQIFGTPDNMDHKSANNSFTVPVPIDVSYENKYSEISGQLHNNSEVNMFTSPSHEEECERRYNQLKSETKSEMKKIEQNFSMEIKQLESYLDLYKAEVEQLQSQIQSITNDLSSIMIIQKHSQYTDDSCGSSFDISSVQNISHTICYCYAQVGAHVH